jgi:hypothetical protein
MIIVTATASSQRVRYVAMGEVNQTRLQVFSADGSQVYDSTFRLGNLIDWHLRDQQGAPLADSSYLFLVTVRDFSNNLTQKYGTAQIEQEQVALQQISRDELPSPQSTALAANRLSEGLSPVDRIAAAGINRTTTTSPTGDTTTGTAASGTSTAEATTVTGENATGTGTQNRIAKWTDNAGTLGDSSITEVGGNVGINTPTPGAALHVIGNQFIKPAGATPTYQVLAGSHPPSTIMLSTDSSAFGWQISPTNTSNETIVQVLGQGFGAVPQRGEFGIYLGANDNSAFKVIQRGGPELFRVNRTGNVGIGTTAPRGGLEVARNWDGAFGALTLTGDRPTIRFSGGAVAGDQQWLLHLGSNNGGGNLEFFNGGTTGTFSAPLMSLTPYGFVGIGTTRPQAKLEVNGGSSVGVNGYSGSYYGVHGASDGYYAGVYGDSYYGFGVQGYSNRDDGVHGTSISGNGVYGYSLNSYAGYFEGKAKVIGHLDVGSCTGCTMSSDQNLKANFSTISPRSVLDRLAALPIRAWNYKSDAPSVRHVGPMAQDFRAAFDLGKDDLHIDMIDANGVTMAAIQGLYQQNQELVTEVRQQNKELMRKVERLQTQLNQVRRSVRRRAAKR